MTEHLTFLYVAIATACSLPIFLAVIWTSRNKRA